VDAPHLDSLGLANCEEWRRVEVDKSHLFKVEHDPLRDPANLCF